MTIPIAFLETSSDALPLHRNALAPLESPLLSPPRLPVAEPASEKLSWEMLALEASFRPALLAKLCNVSLRTLERHFRDRYSVTVSRWLHDLRMARAYELIRSGESVKSAAYQLGFKQLSHFSRSFKAAHGVPPRLFAAEYPSSFYSLLSTDLPCTAAAANRSQDARTSPTIHGATLQT